MGQESTTTTAGDQASPEAQEAAKAAEAAQAADAAATAASTDDKSFSAEYVKGLREEAAKYRTEAKAAADKLKEREDAELSETEKAKKEAKEATERADKAEATAVRSEVAIKKKLSPSMAARLVGETKDELEKDADKLLKDLGPGATAGGFDQGAGRGATPKGGRDWLGQAIAGKGQ
ncbi:MAG TPA: hypothetical protein VK756_07715 [Solirubrobacteraceae bacterium]|jgi:hypothetical protein|nr:hypothetical protein [Solirubrobacteraceae bacterium]